MPSDNAGLFPGPPPSVSRRWAFCCSPAGPRGNLPNLSLPVLPSIPVPSGHSRPKPDPSLTANPSISQPGQTEPRITPPLQYCLPTTGPTPPGHSQQCRYCPILPLRYGPNRSQPNRWIPILTNLNHPSSPYTANPVHDCRAKNHRSKPYTDTPVHSKTAQQVHASPYHGSPLLPFLSRSNAAETGQSITAYPLIA